MRVRSTRPGNRWRWLVAGVVSAAIVTVLGLSAVSPFRAGARYQVVATDQVAATPTPEATAAVAPTPAAKPEPYPGAAYLMEGGELPDVPYKPLANKAAQDRPLSYETRCHQGELGTTVNTCEFGPAHAFRTIALVGDSHSAHWLPALQAVADEFGWHIVSMTKSSCRLGIYGSDTPEHASCRVWNSGVLRSLQALRPDLVLTRATEGSGRRDYMLAASSIPQWRALREMGIPVIALRDNPWYSFDVPQCVATYGPAARRCGSDRAQRGLVEPIVIPAGYTLPTGVHLLDLTDLYCEPTYCPAVVGNVLVLRDSHHFTATYAATMGPYLAGEIVKLMGWQDRMAFV